MKGEESRAAGAPCPGRCYCGHDCAKCVVYLATIRDDAALRERARAFYLREFGLSVPSEDVRCLGARSGEVFALCADCPWMKCCKERGLYECVRCPEYPCAPLAEYQRKYVNKSNQIDI